jgi:hypothetical protein
MGKDWEKDMDSLEKARKDLIQYISDAEWLGASPATLQSEYATLKHYEDLISKGELYLPKF